MNMRERAAIIWFADFSDEEIFYGSEW